MQKARNLETVRWFYRVDRRKISLIKFIFEAYEGVAVVTTVDAAAGLIVLRIAPQCQAIANHVMTDLARCFLIRKHENPS